MIPKTQIIRSLMLIHISFSNKKFALQADHIDIWQIPLNQNYSIAESLLSREEETRANRFHFQKHQRRFTVAHSVLRMILSRYTQIPPLELNFSTGSHGKPALANYSDLQFNLSHSGDTALLAVGKHRPIGIDLEYFSKRPYSGIAKSLYSIEENQKLAKVPLSLKPLVFFNIWTQKEAFIKASGMGLSYPTQEFTVPVLSAQPSIIKDTLHKQTWKILSFMPEIFCCASMCYDPIVEKIHYTTLNHDQLLELYLWNNNG